MLMRMLVDRGKLAGHTQTHESWEKKTRNKVSLISSPTTLIRLRCIQLLHLLRLKSVVNNRVYLSKALTLLIRTVIRLTKVKAVDADEYHRPQGA